MYYFTLFTVGYEEIRNNEMKNEKTNLNFHCSNNHSIIAVVQILLERKKGECVYTYSVESKKALKQNSNSVVSSRIVQVK
jgi:hypothetical protein